VTSRLKLLPPTMLWTCGLQTESAGDKSRTIMQRFKQELTRPGPASRSGLRVRPPAHSGKDCERSTKKVSFFRSAQSRSFCSHRRQNASTEPSAAKKAVAKR
jgi:hypothetical protein